MKFPRGKVLLEQVDATYIGTIFGNCSASLQTFLETVSNTYRSWHEAATKNQLTPELLLHFMLLASSFHREFIGCSR